MTSGTCWAARGRSGGFRPRWEAHLLVSSNPKPAVVRVISIWYICSKESADLGGSPVSVSSGDESSSHSTSGVNLTLSAWRRGLLNVARVLKSWKPLARATVSVATWGKPCPFGQPEVRILEAYDRNGNMVLQCLHANPHCWDRAGVVRRCD